jgi:hypothetical protein
MKQRRPATSKQTEVAGVDSDNTRLEIALKQIEFAREYMLGLIAEVDEDDWFRQPSGAATHIAWQVGHLAVAEYGLGLFRIRGRQDGDAELLTSSFRKQFGKGSQPVADASKYPSPAEIRQVLDRVHRQVFLEMEGRTEAELQDPVENPTALYGNKLGALFFCSVHEMMHAGQIGLLRRLLGKSPLR